MANEKKAVCGGFLIGDGLQMDGKVLSATGGSEILVVHVIWEGDEPEASKTYDEIIEANDNGNIIYAEYYGDYYLMDGWGAGFIRFSHISYRQYSKDNILPLSLQMKEICITSDNKVIEQGGVSGPIHRYVYLNKTGGTYKMYLSDTVKTVYDTINKNWLPVFEYTETGTKNCEYFTCEYSASDKLVLSRRYVEDDGTVKMDILTATGETTKTFTKVTKTIA